MTTLAVLQPGYLPWLGFFDQLLRSDIFIYYDDVQFDKHGWRNRNRIKTPTGPAWLTVPVNHKGKPLVNEIEINNQLAWAKKHTGTLKQQYAKAPYFNEYFPRFEEILCRDWSKLADLDIVLIETICEILEITTRRIRSSELSVQGDKNQRLINFCLKFNVNTYLTGDAARGYLDEDAFKSHGISVAYQRYEHPIYRQQYDDFVPFLSIVDLLFNEGPSAKQIVRNT